MKYSCLINIILFVSFIHGCSSSSSKLSVEDLSKKSFTEKETVQVATQKVYKGVFAQELVSNGKLCAKEKAVIPFLVNEQIISLKVHNGERVEKGTVIARVEPFTFRKQLDDAQNHYEKASIDLEDHLLGYGYNIKDTATVPASILKMARIRSGYNQAVSNLRNAERNHANTIIKAPFSGVISNLQAKMHNPSSQYKYCCELINDAVMQVEFDVLEGEINQVKRGQSIDVIPFATKDQVYQGHITAVNPSINEHGMVSITGEIKNKEGTLIDGMNVRVMAKNSKPDCTIIPKSAVLYRQNRKVVFVKEDSLAKWVYVETGLENSTQVTIVDGSLKEGEEVIVSNNLNLAHETPVAVDNDQLVVSNKQ